jgi:hypothetical protein
MVYGRVLRLPDAVHDPLHDFRRSDWVVQLDYAGDDGEEGGYPREKPTDKCLHLVYSEYSE